MNNDALIKFVLQNQIYYLQNDSYTLFIYNNEHQLIYTHLLSDDSPHNHLIKLSLEIYRALIR